MNAPRRLTRRRALTEALVLAGGGATALGIAGCGTSAGRAASPGGSTLRSTWSDPVGDGQLRVTAGEPLRERLELGPGAAVSTTLATFAHVTDAHVLDASSPARVSFLDRLGPPFQSTFRPQEALTAQVLAGTAAAVRSLSPELVIQGGDLIWRSRRTGRRTGASGGSRSRRGSRPRRSIGSGVITSSNRIRSGHLSSLRTRS